MPTAIAGLFAQREGYALSLIGDPLFLRGSAGYVGASDGWQDFGQLVPRKGRTGATIQAGRD